MQRFREQVVPAIVIGLLLMITSANTEDGVSGPTNQPKNSSETSDEPDIRTATFGLG